MVSCLFLAALKQLISHFLMEMFLAPLSNCVNILQLIRFARVCSILNDFNNRNQFLTAKLVKQGYRYHKIHKAFSKFYYRHSEFIFNTILVKKIFCNRAYRGIIC